MAPRDRLHILVRRPARADRYTSYASGRGSPRPPSPIRDVHARRLIDEAETAAREAQERRNVAEPRPGAQAANEGMLVTFESWPGFELELKSLDPLRQKPELVAVRDAIVEAKRVQLATVYIPEGSLGFFLKRFEQYAAEDTRTGKRRNANMVERIAHLRLATITALWTDDPALFPEADAVVWWEVWLRASNGEETERLRAYAASAGLEVGSRQLVFDRRVIVLVRASADQLSAALDVLDDFAELRAAHTSASFFEGLTPAEQAEWVEDLKARTTPARDEAPAACVLDTGVNRGHPLIEDSLAPDDLHACDPGWGTHDHDGHGTAMAGVALYGDLQAALESADPLRLQHRLESVKILPPTGANHPDLYGAVTAEAVARAEVQAPTRRRAFSMAVTAPPRGTAGTPTSWSAAVDALAAGRDFDTVNGELKYLDAQSVGSQRLFVVAAGNVRDPYSEPYLDRCDLEPVEDPGQAWNALTVGACTDLIDVTPAGPSFNGWTAVGQPGDLSPFSRTSVTFPTQWPMKPEIVLEGGNIARSPAGTDFDWPDALQLLTTGRDPSVRALTTTGATSASTAQAAYMAAVVSAEYPGLWPETIRGLIVHSAEWTDAMRHHFGGATSQRAQEALARRYGFGTPTLERCLRSATNALTLIVQDTIRPYEAGKLREMHTHELPWPTEVLAELGETQVHLRVTLSYFVEPNPTRRGWVRRYRYASHQLRFDLKQPTETHDEFSKRLNKLALGEEEERPATDGSATGWFLGSRTRNRGSLHGDIWTGTAAELSSRGLLAVYPVSGWWKELPSRDRSDLGARYAIVVSIESPSVEADLWTPVAQQVEQPIVIET